MSCFMCFVFIFYFHHVLHKNCTFMCLLMMSAHVYFCFLLIFEPEIARFLLMFVERNHSDIWPLFTLLLLSKHSDIWSLFALGYMTTLCTRITGPLSKHSDDNNSALCKDKKHIFVLIDRDSNMIEIVNQKEYWGNLVFWFVILSHYHAQYFEVLMMLSIHCHIN